MDRLIRDNTTMTFEMLHRMRNRRQGKIEHMAIKLDISKAYDQMELMVFPHKDYVMNRAV